MRGAVSELAFDVLCDFVAVNEADSSLDEMAIAGDKQARGKRIHAESVSDRIGPEDDGIIDCQLLAIDVESFFLQEWSDFTQTFGISRNTNDRESARCVFRLEFDEPGDFNFAGLTPGLPEIEPDDFSAVVLNVDDFSVEILECEPGDDAVFLLRAGYARLRDAGSAIGLARLLQITRKHKQCDAKNDDGGDCRKLVFHAEYPVRTVCRSLSSF